jgi:hypothetical protein
MKKIISLALLTALLLDGCAEIKTASGRHFYSQFILRQGGLVTAKVVNGAGEEIQTLCKDKAFGTGQSKVNWDGRGPDGQDAPVGNYMVVLTEQQISLKPVSHFGGLGSTPGQLLNPQGLCAYPQGSRLTVAVADTGNQRVQIFTDMGGFLQATGQLGTGDGNLNQPTGVCWDGQILTVCDSQNRRLARFDERGIYLGEILQMTGLQTSITTKAILDFQDPVYIQKGSGDDFWVADSGYGVLFHMTSTGGVLEEWGNPFPLALEGPFLQINENFWVQSDHNQIQVINSTGNVTDTLKLNPPSQAVGGMAATPNYAIISDPNQDLLYFVDGDGKTFETSTPLSVAQPTALSLWEDQLFMIDASDHEIFHFQLISQVVDQLNLPLQAQP